MGLGTSFERCSCVVGCASVFTSDSVGQWFDAACHRQPIVTEDLIHAAQVIRVHGSKLADVYATAKPGPRNSSVMFYGGPMYKARAKPTDANMRPSPFRFPPAKESRTLVNQWKSIPMYFSLSRDTKDNLDNGSMSEKTVS